MPGTSAHTELNPGLSYGPGDAIETGQFVGSIYEICPELGVLHVLLETTCRGRYRRWVSTRAGRVRRNGRANQLF